MPFLEKIIKELGISTEGRQTIGIGDGEGQVDMCPAGRQVSAPEIQEKIYFCGQILRKICAFFIHYINMLGVRVRVR